MPNHHPADIDDDDQEMRSLTQTEDENSRFNFSSTRETSTPSSTVRHQSNQVVAKDQYGFRSGFRTACVVFVLLLLLVYVTVPPPRKVLRNEHEDSKDSASDGDDKSTGKNHRDHSDGTSNSSSTPSTGLRSLLYYPPPPSPRKRKFHQTTSAVAAEKRNDDETVATDPAIVNSTFSSGPNGTVGNEGQQEKNGNDEVESVDDDNFGAPGDVAHKDAELFAIINSTTTQKARIQELLGSPLSQDTIANFDSTFFLSQKQASAPTSENDERNLVFKLHRILSSPKSMNEPRAKVQHTVTPPPPAPRPPLPPPRPAPPSSLNLPSFTPDELFVRSFRYLTTEKILSKYGLTNYLLTYASMVAYAAMDRRIVVEPSKTPIALSKLIDIRATEESLADFFYSKGSSRPSTAFSSPSPLYFGIISQQEASIANSKDLWTRSKITPFSARTTHYSFGYRTLTQSDHSTPAASQFKEHFVGAMDATASDVQYFMEKDFFESFPFRAVAPIDSCAVIRRFVPAEKIRAATKEFLGELYSRFGAKYWMAVHLRVEADRGLLRKSMLGMAPAKIAQWWKDHVSSLADRLGIDTIYIASGKFDPRILSAIVAVENHSNSNNKNYQKGSKKNTKNRSARRILIKQNFTVKVDTTESKKTLVTSHEAALVDALLSKEAHAVVSFRPSTFAITAAAYRCPPLLSLSKPKNKDTKNNNKNVNSQNTKFSTKPRKKGKFLSDRVSELLQAPWCVSMRETKNIKYNTNDANTSAQEQTEYWPPLSLLDEQARANKEWLEKVAQVVKKNEEIDAMIKNETVGNRSDDETTVAEVNMQKQKQKTKTTKKQPLPPPPPIYPGITKCSSQFVSRLVDSHAIVNVTKKINRNNSTNRKHSNNSSTRYLQVNDDDDDDDETKYLRQPRTALRGIYLYDIRDGENDGGGSSFTPLEYSSCMSRNFRDQCFRDLTL